MPPLPVVQGRGELTSDGALSGPAVDELDRRNIIVAVEYVGQRIVVDAVTPHHRDGRSAAAPHRGARPPTGCSRTPIGVPVWHSDTRTGAGSRHGQHLPGGDADAQRESSR